MIHFSNRPIGIISVKICFKILSPALWICFLINVSLKTVLQQYPSVREFLSDVICEFTNMYDGLNFLIKHWIWHKYNATLCMLIVQPSHCQQLYFPLKLYAGLSDTHNISYLCLVFETQVVFLFALVFCGVVWRLLGSPGVPMRCFCQARIFVSL